MLQERHILIHTLGIVDEDCIALSGDTQVRLGERIRVRSYEVKRLKKRSTAALFLTQCLHRINPCRAQRRHITR